MNLISDTELTAVKADAEKEFPSAVFYYIGGHAERRNDTEIDEFLSRHPLNSKIASSVADALYDSGEYREDLAQWKECMKLSAEADIKGVSDDAAVRLGLLYYESGEYEEAYKWCLRAAETFGVPEAALAVGSIYEVDETRRDLIQAARYFIMAGKLLATSDFPYGFYYFSDDSLPVNEDGQWVDFELLGEWLKELPKDKRDDLLDLIKSTPAIQKS